MTIDDCINKIENEVKNTVSIIEIIKKAHEEWDFQKLINASEKGLKTISVLHLAQRDLILAIYKAVPSFPQRVEEIENDSLHISVERIDDFSFNVYKITLPYLLPNKRERKVTFKSALTNAVKIAIKRYCEENSIETFKRATVFFVSSHEDDNLNVDNDNKESSIITNSLIGNFIRDDRASVCNTVYYYNKIEKGAKTEIYITDIDNDLAVFSKIKEKKI